MSRMRLKVRSKYNLPTKLMCQTKLRYRKQEQIILIQNVNILRQNWCLCMFSCFPFDPGGTTVCIICEYDALPEIGHACGHNLIAEVGIAASLGIKAAMDETGLNIGKVITMTKVTVVISEIKVTVGLFDGLIKSCIICFTDGCSWDPS